MMLNPFIILPNPVRGLASAAWPYLKPWLKVAPAMLAWAWTLSAPDLPPALWALIFTAIAVAEPFRTSIWPRIEPHALPALGMLAAFIGFLATAMAASSIHETRHTPGGDEAYGLVIASFEYIRWYYAPMAALFVAAVVAAGLTTICIRRWWRAVFMNAGPIEWNARIAVELNRVACSILLLYVVITLALFWNHLVDGGSHYSALKTESSLFEGVAEGVLYERNERPDESKRCENYSADDLIHAIGQHRPDVIPREWMWTGGEGTLTKMPWKPDVECIH